MTVIAQQWTSVDGYAAGPTGEGEIFEAVPPDADAASQRLNEDLLDRVDVVLLGRRSYEAFVQVWPTSTEPIAERVNTVDKVVASRTLTEAPWGAYAAARVEDDALAFVRGCREREETVLVWGSLELMHALVEADLLDELDLFVAPVSLGGGTPLLPAGRRVALRQTLVEAIAGVLHVRYSLR